MEIDKRIGCLNSKTKIMICLVLENKQLSIPEIVKDIELFFDKKSNRETIYRSIESLRELGIVKKDYLPEQKKIKYSLNIKKVELDFIKKKIYFVN